MSNVWYNIPRATKINAYYQVAESTGMAAYAVEKDWWVMQILSAIFEMDIGRYLIFKGGTSLSKAWKLIDRFSEDIDLALDRTYLGIEKIHSRTQIKKLRQETGRYFSGSFATELESRLKKKGLADISVMYIEQESSDADPVKVEVHFPNVIEYPQYITPRVLLEVSCSSLNEPYEIRPINSLLSEFYFESDFAEPAIEVPTATPEKTFLEKLFLLHEEFHRPPSKIRVDRQSRHLYDIYQLLRTDHALKAIGDKELYESIVVHRQAFYHLGGIDYNLHQPQHLDPLPIAAFMNAWKEDYRIMQERMIYGESPPFNTLIKSIGEFTNSRINQLEWEMKVKFPKPEAIEN